MTQICEPESAQQKIRTLKKVKEVKPDMVLVDDLIKVFDDNDKEAMTKMVADKPQEWQEFCDYVLTDDFQKLKDEIRKEDEKSEKDAPTG